MKRGAVPVRWVARLALLSLAAAGADARAYCADLLPDAQVQKASMRQLAADDLLRLRDIGFPDGSLAGPSPLAASPDGKSIAFNLMRAEPDTNFYCRGIVVMPVSYGRPRLIDTGGEFIPLRTFVRGLSVEVGLPALVVPAWSPDGRSVAFLKRTGGRTQVWLASADGSGSRRLTDAAADVESFWWSYDGKRLFFADRPSVETVRAQVEAEARQGWHYDERFTNAGFAPQVREADVPLAVHVLDLSSGSVRAAASEELASRETGQKGEVLSAAGRRAWTKADSASLLSTRRLWAEDPEGRAVRCSAPACTNPDGLWWDPGGEALRILRREGWNREIHAVYRWTPGRGQPVRVAGTGDVVQNCISARAFLLCTRENASTPRQIVRLDPASGRMELLFDPNPEFVSLKLGTVRRLRVRNDRGLEAWADLVLPPDHRPGDKLPMVVVQYQSRGFVRGGTGDEYPIHLLAARGFAVLSFERPPAVASLAADIRSEVEANALNYAGWAERRSVLSALLAAIDAAVATGAVDPRRIGITGLSDGATSVRFALINTDRFAAAAISSCCLEPWTVMAFGGPAWAAFNRAVGFPPATEGKADFWAPMSLALNAKRIRVPLLMQLADEESMLALEAYTALKEQRAPVELFVFPGEHHIKWQPAHRRAVHARNLDWFDFWLQCREDPSPAKSAQYARWRKLKAEAGPKARRCTGTA